MAYSYVWPPSLPQAPQKGFTETYAKNILSTGMDSGVAKTRLRGRASSKLQVSFLLNSSQVSTLETFVDTTLKGVARFGFLHPVKNTVVEVRIVPQGTGELYTLAYVAPGYWSVSMQMEVLP